MARCIRPSRDLLGQLDFRDRLRVVEESCSYLTTLAMKEEWPAALIRASYSDAHSFRNAIVGASRHERLSEALAVPQTLGVLAVLFDTCLLDRVDSVLVSQGGTSLMRFENTARKPTGTSCSILLDLSTVRKLAAEVILAKRARRHTLVHTLGTVTASVLAFGAVYATASAF